MKFKALLVTLTLLVVAAFGWHVSLMGAAAERVRKVPSIAVVHRAVPVEVDINPFTSRVRLGLEVQWASEPKGLLEKLGRQVAGAVVEEHWPEAAEKALRKFAREERDLIGMLWPYRVEVAEREAAQ